jgi:hypothetical protein
VGRHDQLLEFLREMTERFGQFNVVGINQQASNPSSLPITQVTADDSDSEICLIRGFSKDDGNAPLKLEPFYLSLKNVIEQHSDYSLMVSDWFQIDDEHTGRADSPVQDVEVDEDAEVFRLLY